MARSRIPEFESAGSNSGQPKSSSSTSMQLLVRERMQVWPYLVVLAVAFILLQPLCNRIVGMHWGA
jgi:hypothetical protein